jgi:hypothetical protein
MEGVKKEKEKRREEERRKKNTFSEAVLRVSAQALVMVSSKPERTMSTSSAPWMTKLRSGSLNFLFTVDSMKSSNIFLLLSSHFLFC